MGEYDWLNLDLKEHRVFLLHEANALHQEKMKLLTFKRQAEEQEIYIQELEKHLGILQRTLDVILKNKDMERRTSGCGRKKNVCKNHHRQRCIR